MRSLINGVVLCLLLLDNLGAGKVVAKTADVTAGPLIIEKQGSFFVGGREQKSSTLAPGTPSSSPGTITVDQVYVRYQTPPKAGARPNIVLIHGCCLTGKTWETTPDGRMGWDEYFVRSGFSTYVIDQAWRGRSASDPSAINALVYDHQSVAAIPKISSTSHEKAWEIFRFGPKYGEAFPGLEFPLSAVGELWKQMVPDSSNSLPKPNPTAPALSELAKRVGRSILISHSQSGIYPFQTAALDTQGIAGIISIEPAACPSAASDMTSIKSVPFLVLFGDNIAASPVWASIEQACRDYVSAVQAAGGRAQILVLPEIGIKGNSHMLMQDKNNLQIAHLLIDWIVKNT